MESLKLMMYRELEVDGCIESLKLMMYREFEVDDV